MKITHIICTFKQSKRLKELGIAQQSIFTTYSHFEAGNELPLCSGLTDIIKKDIVVEKGSPLLRDGHFYSAYILSEILEMCKPIIETYKPSAAIKEKYKTGHEALLIGTTAMADQLIDAIEQGQLTADSANKCLKDFYDSKIDYSNNQTSQS